MPARYRQFGAEASCHLRRAVAVTLTGLLVLLATSSAFGQASDLDRQKARQEFRKGASAFRAEDYKAALQHFEAAYEINDDGMILYNMSVAYLRLGDRYQALAHAQRAAESGDLSDKIRMRNEARIRGLDQYFGARTAARSIKQNRTTTDDLVGRSEEPTTTAPTPDGDEAGGKASAPGSGTPPSDQPSADPLLSPIGWTGVGLAAAGLGSMAGAAGVESSLGNDLEVYREVARKGDETNYNRLREDIQRRQTVGRTLLYGGIAATGLGLIAIGLEFSDGSESGFSLKPRIPTGDQRTTGLDVGLRW